MATTRGRGGGAGRREPPPSRHSERARREEEWERREAERARRRAERERREDQRMRRELERDRRDGAWTRRARTRERDVDLPAAGAFSELPARASAQPEAPSGRRKEGRRRDEERGRRTEGAAVAPPRRARAAEHRRGSETGARVWVAIPAIVYAIAIVALGGPWFAAGIFVLGVIGLHELYGLMRAARPVDVAGFLALAGILATALLEGRHGMLIALVAAVPLTFLVALARPGRENVAWGIAATLFGVLWVGVALGHAVLLRELDHGGALVTDVLIGTFVGDTCAYFGGRAWGRRPLAPGISPNKTLEGLVTGVVGGTLAFWGFAVAYQDFFAGPDALIIGFCVAVAAPVGDLFESLIKRDLEAKDTGRFFGAHGGVLDRLDAVLFSAVVGYYASLAVL